MSEPLNLAGGVGEVFLGRGVRSAEGQDSGLPGKDDFWSELRGKSEHSGLFSLIEERLI